MVGICAKLTVRGIQHQVRPVPFAVGQGHDPGRKITPDGDVKARGLLGEAGLEGLAAIVARMRVGRHHVLVAGHFDVWQVFEQLNDFFAFAQGGKVLLVDVWPAAGGRIQNFGGVDVGHFRQELVEIRDGRDDGLLVVLRVAFHPWIGRQRGHPDQRFWGS